MDESYGVIACKTGKDLFQSFSTLAVRGFFHSSNFWMISLDSVLSGNN